MLHFGFANIIVIRKMAFNRGLKIYYTKRRIAQRPKT